MKWKSTIGPAIKEARKKANLTQAQLAGKCDLATITIRQYENGSRAPDIDTIVKIANELGIPASTLIEGKTGNVTFDTPDEFHRAWSVLGQQNTKTGEIKTTYYEDGSFANEVVRTNLQRVYSAFHKLNDDGQQEAAKRVEELTLIPAYKKEETPTED